jgi:hypothetical protein
MNDNQESIGGNDREAESSQISDPETTNDSGGGESPNRSWIWWAVIAIVLAIIVIFAASLVFGQPGQEGSAPPGDTTSEAPAPEETPDDEEELPLSKMEMKPGCLDSRIYLRISTKPSSTSWQNGAHFRPSWEATESICRGTIGARISLCT